MPADLGSWRSPYGWRVNDVPVEFILLPAFTVSIGLLRWILERILYRVRFHSAFRSSPSESVARRDIVAFRHCPDPGAQPLANLRKNHIVPKEWDKFLESCYKCTHCICFMIPASPALSRLTGPRSGGVGVGPLDPHADDVVLRPDSALGGNTPRTQVGIDDRPAPPSADRPPASA